MRVGFRFALPILRVHVGELRCCHTLRHCERSEAIQSPSAEGFWIASAFAEGFGGQVAALAMTMGKQLAKHPGIVGGAKRSVPTIMRIVTGFVGTALPAFAAPTAPRWLLPSSPKASADKSLRAMTSRKSVRHSPFSCPGDALKRAEPLLSGGLNELQP